MSKLSAKWSTTSRLVVVFERYKALTEAILLLLLLLPVPFVQLLSLLSLCPPKLRSSGVPSSRETGGIKASLGVTWGIGTDEDLLRR